MQQLFYTAFFKISGVLWGEAHHRNCAQGSPTTLQLHWRQVQKITKFTASMTSLGYFLLGLYL